MRPSWLVCSLLVHATVLGTAWGLGAYAARRAAPPCPRVELLASEAQVAAVPAAVLPPVLAEAADDGHDLLPEPLLPLGAALPPPRDTAPARPRRQPTLDSVRPPAPPEPPAPPVAAAPPAPAPAPATSARVEAEPLADNAPPDYPPTARQLGHEGTVWVTLHVDAFGVVVGAELARPCPHPALNRAALQAARRWRFRPAQQDGRAVPSALDLPVVFRLVDR